MSVLRLSARRDRAWIRSVAQFDEIVFCVRRFMLCSQPVLKLVPGREATLLGAKVGGFRNGRLSERGLITGFARPEQIG
jgi:hypothetical protein